MPPAATTFTVSEATRKKWSEQPLKQNVGAAPVLDLTVDNITENVIAVNSNLSDNPRLQYLITKFIRASHDFIRDVGLNFDEWEQVWKFLTSVGQISTDVRHEMVLLSDILGISALVDSISHPVVPGATESSLLGPFHDDKAHLFELGDSITSDGTPGEATLVRGTIKDIDGTPVDKALIDVWETDGNGTYDVEYVDKDGPDFRGKLYTDEKGAFYFSCVRPVPYPIANDGPVGALLRKLNRHWYRPAHMHFMILHPSYEKLITALYTRDSEYITSDTVFGVKSSLMVDYVWTEDLKLAERYGVKPFKRVVDGVEKQGFWLLEHDFILVKKQDPALRKTHD